MGFSGHDLPRRRSFSRPGPRPCGLWGTPPPPPHSPTSRVEIQVRNWLNASSSLSLPSKPHQARVDTTRAPSGGPGPGTLCPIRGRAGAPTSDSMLSQASLRCPPGRAREAAPSLNPAVFLSSGPLFRLPKKPDPVPFRPWTPHTSLPSAPQGAWVLADTQVGTRVGTRGPAGMVTPTRVGPRATRIVSAGGRDTLAAGRSVAHSAPRPRLPCQNDTFVGARGFSGGGRCPPFSRGVTFHHPTAFSKLQDPPLISVSSESLEHWEGFPRPVGPARALVGAEGMGGGVKPLMVILLGIDASTMSQDLAAQLVGYPVRAFPPQVSLSLSGGCSSPSILRGRGRRIVR